MTFDLWRSPQPMGVFLNVALILPMALIGQEKKPEKDYDTLPPALVGYDASVHVHIGNAGEAQAVRQKVIDFLWPVGGLPIGKVPVSTFVYKGEGPFPAELAGLTENLVGQVEKIDVHVDFGYHSFSYLVHPTDPKNADRLAIIHQGHQGELKDGIDNLANHLLTRGFSVMLMQMPLVGWNTDNTFDLPSGQVAIEERSVSGHNQMFPALEGKGGSTLRFFIEPVVVGVNYFIGRNPKYRDICMIGLSGGGWTTHVATALDARIKLSIPVAGAYPLYLQEYYPESKGDTEQILPALYQDRASWLDLYILSGHGKGRRQIQVLNQFDTCCFYGIGSRTYGGLVSDVVKKLGAGQWECVIDSSHQGHKISDWAIGHVIDPALGADG